MRSPRPLIVSVLAAVLSLSAAVGAYAQAKRPIGYDAYNSWRAIEDTTLSEDGRWLAYALVEQEGDGELVVRNLREGTEYRYPRGTSPVITADGRFVVFTIVPPLAETQKARQEKKKPEEMPKNGLGIMALADGSVTAVDRVESFKVPESGARVAYLKEKSEARSQKPDAEGEKAEGQKKKKKKEPGTELVVRDLATGTENAIAEVAEYVWSKDGAWLAYGVSSTRPADDGAFVRNAQDGRTIALLTGEGHYKRLVFDEAGGQLAFVSDKADYAKDASPYRLYYWYAGQSGATELVTMATSGMPAGYAVSEHGRLAFSKDGARLFLGTAPAPEPPPGDDAPEPIDVDLWHYKDPLLQTMQDVRADNERKRTFRAVVHVKDKRFAQLASPDMPDVTEGDDPAVVLGRSNVPYQQLISWDGSYDDVFVVNVGTGARTRILERTYYGASLSPGGKYVLYFDGDSHDWWTYRISDGTRTNLTETIDPAIVWEDETHDTPNQPRPYGVAGWTADDAAVLVYDRYDIWALDPGGRTAPRNATGGAGRAAQIVFRYRSLDPDARIVPAAPVVLSATNDRTKAEGFYRATLTASRAPEPLLRLDKALGNPIKARKADVVVFTQSRFDEFPDLWVSDLSFAAPSKVSDANPQMAQYLWGRSELIEYTNNDGKRLKAILTKPENFDPSKKYPLLVYIYEQLSQDLHTFIPPAPSHRLNLSRYASNGYVILRPDIVYETGYPGEAAEKAVLPAVQQVVEMGFIDRTRIGIQGHSWGGYQIAHLITRTDIFAAAEGGALVANMISAYGGIRWQTGMSRAFQYEKTQSRIGAPPWEAPLQYIENSPIFWVQKVTTPFMTVHNDEDGAVPWYQGIEFFSALRRLGKEVYMFNYRGEGHHVLKRPNQKHFTVHMDEFFDHYLLGAPRPAWMDTGVPFLERGTRDVSPLFDRKATEPTDGQGSR